LKLALFLSPVAFEDFFDQIGVTRETYVASFQNDWSFDYIRLWQSYGIEVVMYHFSRRLSRVEVLTHEPTGCTVKFFPMPMLDRLQPLVRGRHLLSVYLSSLSPTLLLDLRRERPDIIYVQEYEWGRFDVLVLFGKILGISVVAQYQGADGKYEGRGAFIRRWAIRNACKLLCVNRNEYQRATGKYPGLDGGKLEILYHPVDSAQFYPMDKGRAQAELGLPADRRYLLFVGRLHPHKGIPYLLEAHAKVQPEFPDTTLLLIGTGPLESELKSLVVQQGWQNVRFEGWVASKDKLRLYLGASEFLTMSSLRESFCIAATEAMACGRPVLGTAVDGLLEQISDGENGFLVPPGDAEALAEKMAYLLENPERCVAMGKAARETFERRFSTIVIGPQLSQILAQAYDRCSK
jgi:glycosyltransferase involved in cell wall biosynthesis